MHGKNFKNILEKIVKKHKFKRVGVMFIKVVDA